MSAWWSEQAMAWIGAIGGSGVGIVCGTLGALGGWLAPRGKGKAVLVPLHAAVVIIGIAALGTGIVAVSMGQPYHVWYPLLLGGFIMTMVMGGLLPVVLLRYRQAEQRRLEAEELRRG